LNYTEFLSREKNHLDEATIIAQMTEKSLTPALRLKSQSDNSYPGMVLEDGGTISVIYYSSEPNGQSRIYITRLQLP